MMMDDIKLEDQISINTYANYITRMYVWKMIFNCNNFNIH